MSGYFYPPSTGDYTFYLAADDGANLYLSTDEDPANKKLIAVEAGWSNPRSYTAAGGGSVVENKSSLTYTNTAWPTKDSANGGAKITLTKGKAYYIEALEKEGGGGDDLSVAVQDAAGAIDASMPIPGSYLSPFGVSTDAKLLAQPKNALAMAGTSASFSIGLDIPPGVTLTSVKWAKNGVDIANSDNNTLIIPVAAADNGAKIVAIVTTSKGVLTSSEATLTVATLSNAFAAGVVKLEIYTAITGTTVDMLTGDPKYPGSPDAIQLITSLSTPNGYGDNYGARVTGFIIPPASGDYRFFVYSDDSSQLFLSPDDKEANAVMIAEEASCCNAFSEPGTTRTSEPQSLVAGKKYAFYALLKEGGGGDYLQVAVRKEGDTTPASALTPIPSSWLGANAKPDLGDPQIDKQPPATLQLVEGTPLNLAVAGSIVPTGFNFPLSVQWQKNGQNIAGATSLSFVIATATQTDSGTYHAVLSAPNGKSVTSSDSVVTVIADKVAATVAKVTATGADVLAITFSEAVDKTTAETLANYSLTSGLTIKTATLGGTGNNVVRLTLGGTLVSGSQYTLMVNNVKDLFNNVTSNLQVPFTARIVTYADVILADKPVVFYQFEETTGQKTKNFGTAGTDGDGLYMMGNGPDDSAPADATTEEGPRPPSFLGFGGGNNSGSFGGATTMLWIDAQKQWLNNLGAFSLEYWVKPANRVSDPTAFGTRIGIVGQNDAVEYGFINPTTIQIWTPGGSLDIPYSFPDNTWHHVATIADGKSIKNYFDGVYINQYVGTTANYGSSTYNVHVGGGGAFDATGNFFTGAIDEVAIFDKAIPADRIASHFKAGKEGGELPAPEAGQQPSEFGQTVNGFQDSFTGATRDPNWVAVGPGGDHYVQQDGVLKVFPSLSDPNHLIYMGQGASNTVSEVLARIRVVNFSIGDPARGGIAVNVSSNTTSKPAQWIGMNLNIRNNSEGTPASTVHYKILDDLRGWGPQTTFGWTNNGWNWMRLRQESKMDGTNTVFAKVWAADTTTPEPADWQVKWADASLPTPQHGGYSGITGCSGGGVGQFEVSYILIKSASLPSIKVDFAPTAPALIPPVITGITGTTNNANVSIHWFGGGLLQKAAVLTGPWLDVTNTLPPLVETLTGAKPAGPQNFYRMKQ